MTDRPGAIPRQLIAEMAEAGYIKGSSPETLQPSSLDLRITDEAYRMRGSYLPKIGETIEEIITRGALYKHDLARPLEVDGTYLIKLNESLALPMGIHATVSSKSSSGRINLRTRLLADRVPRFDSVPRGYTGSLWIEIMPKSFPVLLHPHDRLNQMRFFHGDAELSSLEHRIAFDKFKLLRNADGTPVPASDHVVGNGVTMTVDLASTDIIGWRATSGGWNVLDTAKYDHDPRDFFEPIAQPKSGELVLRHGLFYILVTKERILIPPNYAAEMAAYDPTKGEFRSHYAGFFDPGFGWAEKDEDRGWQAVLEVSMHGHDFILRDGQPICLMAFEKLLLKPDMLYGRDIKSNYGGQSGPRLAKWFKSME
jgi:dCTP deaminase